MLKWNRQHTNVFLFIFIAASSKNLNQLNSGYIQIALNYRQYLLNLNHFIF